MTNTKKILLCGIGNIGYRYLESITQLDIKLELCIYDLNYNLIEQQTQSLNSENITLRKLFSIDSLEGEIDLCIIATTANNRTQLIKLICDKVKVNNWLLEKLITQSSDELLMLKDMFHNSSKVYVNYIRRESSWYNRIKEELKNQDVGLIEIHNINFELACNAIHFIDIVEWIFSVKTSKIETQRQKVSCLVKFLINFQIYFLFS